MKKPIVLSGMQPTSKLHIGNYFGAILQWLKLKEKYHCIFFVADLHSLTTRLTSKTSDNLHDNSLEVLATYIACGLEVQDNLYFTLQSQLFHHPYFHWILSCITSIGRLNAMGQMKDKSKQYGDYLGILTYPVLMASDILLYNPQYVPVGEDQQQHLELTRELAIRLNNLLETNYFYLPQNLPAIGGLKKIKDLKDGTKKMSKSSGALSCIFLRDDKDTIMEKIKRAKTDSFPMPSSFTEIQETRPEIRNLLEIYSGFTEKSLDKLIEEFSLAPIQLFKNKLTQVVIESLDPITRKIEKLLQHPMELQDIMREGKLRAEQESKMQMEIVCQKILGYYPF